MATMLPFWTVFRTNMFGAYSERGEDGEPAPPPLNSAKIA